ncbi:hypothetical protein [Streptomyces sp. NRRL S-87]|uniref:hypothetical protein n=1 Tax=Streptomyces sp. NRRL S-87 TaxID=1463920 RepID=UPI000690E779|nr:hypothetical protein [Streptomyces sp. NRRL S-87]
MPPRTLTRLLLLAGVLLGLTTMHTLGHPSAAGHSPTATGTAQMHSSAAMAHTPSPAAAPHAPDRAVAAHTLPRALAAHSLRGADPAHAHTPTAPADGGDHPRAGGVGSGGMDPMAVCLAVLTALTALWLARALGDVRAQARPRVHGAPGRTATGRSPPDRLRLMVMRV